MNDLKLLATAEKAISFTALHNDKMFISAISRIAIFIYGPCTSVFIFRIPH